MTKNMVWMVPVLATALVGGPGCKKKDGDNANEKVVAKETGSGAAEAKPDMSKKGINDPSNDPKVVTIAKQLMTDCAKTLDESTGNSNKPNQKKGYYSCDKWGADFSDQKFEKDSVPTFLNFLEDPDVKVRAIGVLGLGKTYDWRSDKAQAQRVIDGLKKEKAPSPIDHNWALKVADISSSAGLDDQIKGIATDPNTSLDVRTAILAWWRGGEPAYQAVKANATTTDPGVMNAVVQGYINHFKEHTDEACAYWADHLETPNDSANEYALGHMTGGWGGNTTGDTESEDYITGGGGGPSSSDDKRCSEAQLGKALDLIEKQFNEGKGDSKLTYALAFMAKDKLTPKPLKERTDKLLKAMVEKKGQWLQRRSALEALVEADPANKAYAKKFAKDEDLKDKVEDLLKKK